MDQDTNQAPDIIDRQALRTRIEQDLRTAACDDALDAIIHSLNCVLAQHLRAAWKGLRDEVADLLLRNEFDDIPVLKPRHFLPKYQGSSDSLQVPESRYGPGPSV